MKPLAEVCQMDILQKRQNASIPARFILTILFVSVTVLGGYAQTVSWSDSFQNGMPAGTDHCLKWTAFLDQLGNKKFVSVKFSGSQDPIGKTISDPAAATELAKLLYERRPGVVTINGDNWVVTTCGISSCGAPSVALSWNGNIDGCLCEDQYAIKPHTGGLQWGGLNSISCDAVSQDFALEFNSGVSIKADGPTTLCQGENVTLEASTDICQGGPYTYKWSTGETTPAILVSSAGDFFVTVYGPDLSCNGMSETVHVTVTDISLTVTEQFTLCDEAVTLSASGTSTGGTDPTVNKYCLFDIAGGDCSFTTNLCDDQYRKVVNESFSQILPAAKPSKIIVRLYYGQVAGQSEFNFYINGRWIESYTEIDAPRSCVTGAQYPRSFSFSAEDLDGWDLSADKNVTVQISTDNGEIYFAGIVVETEMPGETYSWSPVDGLLSSPFTATPLAKPSATTNYTVTYTDASGCHKSADVLVTVKCSTIPCKELTVPVAENCLVSVSPDMLYDGTVPAGMTFVADPPAPYGVGIHKISITATLDNVVSSCIAVLTVTDNIKPTITVQDISVQNDPGQCYATVDLLDPLTRPVLSDNCSVSFDKLTKDKDDNQFYGVTSVIWTVTDANGNMQTATQKVTVTNATPAIASVVASSTSVSVNVPVTLTTTYSDNNVTTATIDWGDGSALQTVSNPETGFAVSHAYSSSGSYSAKITLTDACEASTYAYQSIVVLNQLGASVSGSGWFESPAGAYLKDKRAAGKASFAFTASIRSYSDLPAGRASFDFRTGNLRFRSTEYQWLVIDGKTARLKAYGIVSNTPGYEILISMVQQVKGTDPKPKGKKPPKQKDLIRVRISDPFGIVIYDTQLGSPDDAVPTTSMGGGSIEVEEATSTFSQTYESPVASSFGEESTSAYPNPFTDWVEVQFNSGSQENVIIELLDLAGKTVFNEVFPASIDGSYSFNIPENTNDQPGVYILTIKQGKKVNILRVVRN